MLALTIVCLLVISASLVEGNSRGAPAEACSTITPGHGGSSQTIPGGFFIYSNLIDCGGTYTANTAYTIRLEGSQQFKGFLIQARQSGTTTPIGSFSSLPSGTETLSCSGVTTASVTHINSVLKASVEFTWTSPSTPGTVEFRYAVVIQFSTYYANINATDHRPPGSMCTTTSSSDVIEATSSAATGPETTSDVIEATSSTATGPETTSDVIEATSSTATGPETTSVSVTPTTNGPLTANSSNSPSPTNSAIGNNLSIVTLLILIFISAFILIF